MSAVISAPPIHHNSLDVAGHDVQFYVDDSYLVDHVSGLLASNLTAGNAGLVIATSVHRDLIQARLGSRGVDVASALSAERLVLLDAAETMATFLVGERPDPDRFEDVIGSALARVSSDGRDAAPRVFAFGEMVALLWARGNRAGALEVERLWNRLAETYRFRLHCAYPLAIFRRAEDCDGIAQICAEHSQVMPAESYSALDDEEERRREITRLQQKASVLEAEIEARKRTEEALLRRTAELREALADRDEFLSVAAHELKTPLTSLRAYAQLLLREVRRQRPLDLNKLEFILKTIEQQSGKMNQLIARLLDTNQIEEGHLRVDPLPTDLVSLVHAVIAQFELAPVEVSYEGLTRLDVMVDPVRFEQVITNLVGNAVKFSPRGSTVKVRVERTPDLGARLVVVDQGCGVPRDSREAIFRRFHRASADRYVSGMGLGLYVSREIVQLHGGSVHVEDSDAPGSQFIVTLSPSAIVG